MAVSATSVSGRELGELRVRAAALPQIFLPRRGVNHVLLSTPLSSISAQCAQLVQGQLSLTLSRVSSGMRVTKAADDAAGLPLHEPEHSGAFRWQAIRNANDGISVIQTAESATKRC